MKKSLKGVLLTLAGAMAWGLSGTSSQYLMATCHVDPIWLTSQRLLGGGILLSIIGFYQCPEKMTGILKNKTDRIQLLKFAIFGLLFSQLTYITTISNTNAGTATVLQYLCPIVIIFYMSLKTKTLPSVIEFCSIALALIGTFLIATHGNIHELAITPKGLAWGLTSAIAYSLYMLLPDRLIHDWGSISVTGLGLLFGGIVFYVGSQAWQYHINWTPMLIVALVGGVIISGTVLAYTLFLSGMMLIGPIKGSLIASTEPISAVFFSALLLHQVFGLMDILGMVSILSAVILITLKDQIYWKKLHKNT